VQHVHTDIIRSPIAMEASAQSTVETLCPDYDEVRSSLSCSDGPAEK